MEPMERVVIDVPETYQGAVMTALGARKAVLMNMQMLGSRSRLEFRMPSRGLFGYRSQFLTDTHGEGIMNTIFDGYEEWAGEIATRSTGSLISFETGDAVTYGLFNAQQRGTLLVLPGEKVYAGEVVGYTPTGEDITVNVCKTKHLTNTRASGSDDALRLTPVSKFSLEACLEFLAPDELLEVTPESLRIRKRILDHDLRMRPPARRTSKEEYVNRKTGAPAKKRARRFWRSVLLWRLYMAVPLVGQPFLAVFGQVDDAAVDKPVFAQQVLHHGVVPVRVDAQGQPAGSGRTQNRLSPRRAPCRWRPGGGWSDRARRPARHRLRSRHRKAPRPAGSKTCRRPRRPPPRYSTRQSAIWLRMRASPG